MRNKKIKFFFWKLKVIFIKNISINSFAFKKTEKEVFYLEGKVSGFSAKDGFKIAIKWDEKETELLTLEEIESRGIIIIN